MSSTDAREAGRQTPTQPEDEHRDDQAPEVQLLAVSKGVLGCRRLLAELESDEQEDAIERVDSRIPSDSIAELPVTPATINLVTAIATLATIAP